MCSSRVLRSYCFGRTGFATPYSAAGGLIVLLIWVYYSAQVFLFGAEFTKVHARQFGSQKDACCHAAAVAPSIARTA